MLAHGEAEALVRRYFELLERSRSVDEAMPRIEPLLHPDAEYVSPPDALEPGTWRGIDGWRGALQSGRDGLGEAARFDVVEATERGDRVFVRLVIETAGDASGLRLAGPTVGIVVTLDDGRIRRFEWRWEPDEARALFEEGAA